MGIKGLIIPVKPDGQSFAAGAASSNTGDIASLWKSSNAKPRPGETRIFYGQGGDKETVLALVGVGKTERLSENELKERSRTVAAAGVKALRDVGCTEVEIETGSGHNNGGLDAHAAAVGLQLALHRFDWKTSSADKAKKAPVSISQAGSSSSSSETADAKTLSWKTGQIYSQCQNLARELQDTPANLMTPTIFAERAKKEFEGVSNVTVNVHDEAWAKEKGMRTFLSVAAGTEEPAKFVEIIYKGASGSGDATDVAFVGKGITFDSGGISLKPGADMKAMRSDMGGASAVLSALLGIAKLKLPINMVLCIPLTENMPSGKATKPGDMIVAMNGKTVEIDNTDAEGRLVLSDALYYASSVYKPKVVIDAATLTGAQAVALGDVFAGAFVTDDGLWNDLNTAAEAERDQLWRMPFHDNYLEYINKTGHDLCNTGGRYGGACTAAIFLKQFIAGLEPKEDDDGANDKPQIQYAHLDIAGVMSMGPSAQAYDIKGMNGKPVRALIEFVRRRALKL